MFPGMNPRDVQKAMKRLGISQQEIEAEEVIIRTPDKDMIIKDPQVSRVNMMGQDTFQISGAITEVDRIAAHETNEEDIRTIMEQANCAREDAINSLEASEGNIAEAILKLQKR